MIISPDMVNVLVNTTCVSHNVLTQRGDNVVARVKNGDYDDEGYGVFVPIANKSMQTGS